ncbi:MAG: alpha-ketoacid dehydrogenase subunit beta, partial [Chloroflexi bacterium]|nr:alpha-ketoacid dehydrogenase subunit beta [Chloroflexota bacterium]
MPELTYAQALNAALREEMQRDPAIVMMGEDIATHGGVFTVSKGLLAEFGPERVRDTPISEAAFVGLAAGAAATGLRPVVEIMYMDFMFVAADSVVNQVAKMRYMTGGQVKVPLVIRTQQGGGRGNAAQHSQSPDAMWAHVPGLKVVLPATPYDAKGLLKSAIRDDNPVMVIEHKLLYPTKGEVPDGEYSVPIGRADIKRAGNDVTIVAISRSVLHALAAADKLAAEGISAEVIDARSIRPMDFETIVNSLKKTNRMVLAHEAVRFGSILGEISATVQEMAF